MQDKIAALESAILETGLPVITLQIQARRDRLTDRQYCGRLRKVAQRLEARWHDTAGAVPAYVHNLRRAINQS